jgi:hypothetical protein
MQPRVIFAGSTVSWARLRPLPSLLVLMSCSCWTSWSIVWGAGSMFLPNVKGSDCTDHYHYCE